MNRREIIALLAIATAFDNRTVGEANISAWTDSARRGRWAFEEASDAIKDYYTSTTDARPFVMPNHITHRVSAVRRDRLDRQVAHELTHAGPPNPRVVSAIENFAQHTVIPEPREPRQPALRVPCAHCGAQRGQSCTRPSRGAQVQTKPHPSRVEAGEAHVAS